MKKFLLTIVIVCTLFSCNNGGDNSLGVVILPVSTFKAVLPAQKDVAKYSRALDSITVKLDSYEKYMKDLKEMEALGAINTENYREAADAINLYKAKHYKDLYPGYKIILESTLTKVLEDHNLGLTNFYNYKGSIPKECLDNIIAFTPKQTYLIYKGKVAIGQVASFYDVTEAKLIREDANDFLASHPNWGPIARADFEGDINIPSDMDGIIAPFTKRDNLYIAADFASLATAKTNDNSKIIVSKDPIVFLRLGEVYIVITSWGDEKDLIK